jgi:putative MFS transporter
MTATLEIPPKASERTSPAWIAARMNRLPATAAIWKLVVLLSLAGWFELYDLFFTGYIAPGLAKSHILATTTQKFFGFSGMGAFVAVTFAGLFVGTFFLGFLTDKYGRRFIFTYALLWYSAATAIMACQNTITGLFLCRFIAGVGVGVVIIAIDTYITELVPRRIRGRAFALNQAIMFCAVPIVAVLSWQLVPRAPLGMEGWRWVVLIGSAGAIFVWFIRRTVPESPFWLAQNGQGEAAGRIVTALEAKVEAQSGRPLPEPVLAPVAPRKIKASMAEVLTPPYRSRLFMLVLFNIFQVIGYYGFANWVPSLLLANGIEVTKSLAYSAVIAVAYPIGPLLGMTFADKVDRKWVIIATAVIVALVGSAFTQFRSAFPLIVCGVLISLANAILSYAYHAYQVEVFPTSIRGRAAGIAYSSSRLGAIMSGFLLAFCLREFGVVGAFGLITFCMVGVMVVIGVFGPSRRELESDSAGADA